MNWKVDVIKTSPITRFQMIFPQDVATAREGKGIKTARKVTFAINKHIACT